MKLPSMGITCKEKHFKEIAEAECDDLAMVLVCPTSKIAIAFDGECNISHHRHHIRFPIVKGFQGGKEDSVPLQ